MSTGVALALLHADELILSRERLAEQTGLRRQVWLANGTSTGRSGRDQRRGPASQRACRKRGRILTVDDPGAAAEREFIRRPVERVLAFTFRAVGRSHCERALEADDSQTSTANDLWISMGTVCSDPRRAERELGIRCSAGSSSCRASSSRSATKPSASAGGMDAERCSTG